MRDRCHRERDARAQNQPLSWHLVSTMWRARELACPFWRLKVILKWKQILHCRPTFGGLRRSFNSFHQPPKCRRHFRYAQANKFGQKMLPIDTATATASGERRAFAGMRALHAQCATRMTGKDVRQIHVAETWCMSLERTKL